LEEEYVGGRIILKRISKLEREKVKSIGLAQNGDNLCAFVNPVMGIFFPRSGGFFSLYEELNFLRTLL